MRIIGIAAAISAVVVIVPGESEAATHSFEQTATS